MQSRAWFWLSLLCGVGMALGGWWITGNQSDSVNDPALLDHIVKAPEWTDRFAGLAGLAGLVATGLSLSRIKRHVDLDELHRRWLVIAITLGAIGLAFGYFGRILTAGTEGANLGAGILVVLGTPFAVLAIIIVVASWRLDPR